MTEEITLQHFLIISSIMFFAGIFGFIIRHNLITMLMSVELILNAVNINFIAFNYFLHPERMHGLFFALIVVGIAAAEASVAIALIINVYRRFSTITVEEVSEMKY
ncbi:MAG: NADH-quinone oxidoreductase subunit NuoK [Bacteroidota bacterium]|jgi:NADH-quinone oxidoreductase subunit K